MAVSGRKTTKTFSSTLDAGSGEDFELFCQPCDIADLRFPAYGFCTDCEEHLCESCFNHHQRSKPSRHHKLLDTANMPQTQQVSSKSAKAEQCDHLTKPCHKHTKEVIKFYCNDHEALLCNVCVTLEHNSSCKVSYIPDISENSLDSEEYKITIKKIDVITREYKKIKTDLKGRIEQSNCSLKDVLDEIKKLRYKINQKLDEMEKAAEKATNGIQLDNETSLNTTETSCDDAVRSLKASSDSIKALNKSKQADNLFLELQHAKQLITGTCNKSLRSCLKSLEHVQQYYFVPSNTVANLLENEKSLGNLAIKTFKPSSSPPVVAVETNKPSLPRPLSRPVSRLRGSPRKLQGRSSSPLAGQSNEMTNEYQPPPTETKSKQFSQQTGFFIMSPKEKSCWITGMTLLDQSQLVITDSKNFSIKLIDLKTNTIIHQLQLNLYYPLDITSVSQNKTAITMPGKQIIQFVSATSNMLSFERSFTTDGECLGISHHEGRLVVSFWTPPKLQILNLEGTVLRTITTDQNGLSIFQRPTYVLASKNCIYVSDTVLQVTVMLNWLGEKTGCPVKMGFPQGIEMLDDRSILVSDPQKNKCTIENISGDLRQRDIVLRHLKEPTALCWCSKNRQLYVSCYTNGKHVIDNYIQVFKMQ